MDKANKGDIMIPHTTLSRPTLAAMLLSAAFLGTSALAAERS